MSALTHTHMLALQEIQAEKEALSEAAQVTQQAATQAAAAAAAHAQEREVEQTRVRRQVEEWGRDRANLQTQIEVCLLCVICRVYSSLPSTHTRVTTTHSDHLSPILTELPFAPFSQDRDTQVLTLRAENTCLQAQLDAATDLAQERAAAATVAQDAMVAQHDETIVGLRARNDELALVLHTCLLSC